MLHKIIESIWKDIPKIIWHLKNSKQKKKKRKKSLVYVPSSEAKFITEHDVTWQDVALAHQDRKVADNAIKEKGYALCINCAHPKPQTCTEIV